jgi:hypothetical protein
MTTNEALKRLKEFGYYIRKTTVYADDTILRVIKPDDYESHYLRIDKCKKQYDLYHKFGEWITEYPTLRQAIYGLYIEVIKRKLNI